MSSFHGAQLAPAVLGKICHRLNNVPTNKEPTHLKVAEDAVFLGSVQPTGRRSRELCTATHQEVASGG